MSRWPSFNLGFGSKAPSLPVDGVEELPDFYRMLDPLFANKKRDYGGVYPCYRDEEGVFHHPTYRPFPPLVPPPKKLPPDERPTYVERMRLPPPEELPPTDLVPEVPPWKQRLKPEHKKKKKRHSNQAGPSKALQATETSVASSTLSVIQAPATTGAKVPSQLAEAHSAQFQLPRGIPVPNSEVDHEDSEQEYHTQLLVQAKQIIIGLIEAVCGCIHEPTPSPLQL